MPAVDFDDLVAMQDPSVRATSSSGPRVQHTASPKSPQPKKDVPPVMVVQHWDWKADPTGRWMSEKFDGCRAWWDGKNLISRRGNIFAAPDWFKARLPKVRLDGELWLGRGLFSRASGVCRGGSSSDWEDMKFMVFDAPDAPGGFEQRLVALHTEVQLAGFDQLIVVEQVLVQSRGHLLKLLDEVETGGGEGLVLRHASSVYTAGDSQDAQKVVKVRTAEAVVIGHTKGKGNRDQGCGSLICQLPNGNTFKCGSGLSFKLVMNPPPVGTTITFGYKKLTDAGVPREPRFIRVRDDI